jgi:hypothetical protein
MRFRLAVTFVASAATALLPGAAFAQSVNVTRAVLPTQPYTLIYPEPMVAVESGPSSLTINHPNAPLQCDLSVVAVEDTGWTADGALSSLDDAEVTASWTETFPGFAIGAKTTTQYQDATALLYDGTSTGSPQGVPLTIVHTETVSGGNGYALDCLFATDVAAQARPIVDFIIANFSTRADAECCIGVEVEQPEVAPAQ